MEERKQFTFYRSYFEALSKLPRERRLGVLEAVIAYALDGTEPEGLDDMQAMAFLLIRPTLDTGRKKAAAGSAGGSKTQAKRKQKASKEEKEKEIENELGREVSLRSHPAYGQLPARYAYPQSLGGVGLIRVKMPMANCVDGSGEGVSIYAPAVELMALIAENEAQLRREFSNGSSRLVVSRDMLDRGQLKDDVFVALDESPETVGITVFSPQLREQSYLNRQQAYLRAMENIIGLKRGLLSQVEAVDRTATEITSSEGEYMSAIWELRRVWEQAAAQALALERRLTARDPGEAAMDWGDGLV